MGFTSKYLLFIAFAGLIFLSGCKKPRTRTVSEVTKTELENLAESGKETKIKYHELGKILSQLVKESLEMGSDSLMLAHIKNFASLNEEGIKQLSEEIDDWQKTLSEEERIFFVMRLVPMKYARNLERYKIAFSRRTGKNSEQDKALNSLLRPLEIRR
ncbi:hypothetical protein N9933_02210 [bacterium]|nr:hypothetical protein [bacterium]